MSKNKIEIFKGEKEIEVTEKAYRVVYKDMGFRPTDEKAPEKDLEKEPEKPISKMTKAELENKAFEYALELESTLVDDMRKELAEKIEELEEQDEE